MLHIINILTDKMWRYFGYLFVALFASPVSVFSLYGYGKQFIISSVLYALALLIFFTDPPEVPGGEWYVVFYQSNALGILHAAVVGLPLFLRSHYSCPWCGCHQLSYIGGKVGKSWWRYHNKDMSRDKRVKKNYEQSNFMSEWVCKKCEAKSKAVHKPSSFPSRLRPIISVKLKNRGKGKRTAKDWTEVDFELLSGPKRKDGVGQ